MLFAAYVPKEEELAASTTKLLNRMTARWLAVLPNKATTVSAAGAWPLLALLLSVSTGDARAQLQESVGLTATGTIDAQVTAAALEVIRWLCETRGLSSALGLWVKDSKLRVHPEWLNSLPAGTADRLTDDLVGDKRRLDDWASAKTRGMIPEMPTQLFHRTLFVLATAITMETSWADVFSAKPNAPYPTLSRSTRGANIIRASEHVTTVCVQGNNGQDVHLVLGAPDEPPATVLPLGMAAIGSAVPPLARDGDIATVGPGITTGHVVVYDLPGYGAQVNLEVPPFTVRDTHDLLDYKDVFGLNGATDWMRNNFPGISTDLLAVDGATQAAFAKFTATGFTAAAVTSTAGFGGSAPPRPTQVVQIKVTFNRPFGFLAVHRHTGVVLFAGWVIEDKLDQV